MAKILNKNNKLESLMKKLYDLDKKTVALIFTQQIQKGSGQGA